MGGGGQKMGGDLKRGGERDNLFQSYWDMAGIIGDVTWGRMM